MKIKEILSALTTTEGLATGITSIGDIGSAASLGFEELASAIGISTTALGGFIAAAAGIIAVVKVVDLLVESFAEAKQKAEESRQSYNDTKSELESVESELETTSSRIDELKSKGSLTIVEQAELAKLESTNQQLLTQQAILQKLAEYKQKSAADDANDALTKQQTWKSKDATQTASGTTFHETYNGDIIDKAASRQALLNSKTEEYKKLQEDLTNLDPPEESGFWDKLKSGTLFDKSEYENTKEAMDALNSEIEDMQSEQADDMSTISELYSSLFDDAGNVLPGYEDTAARVQSLMESMMTDAERAELTTSKLNEIVDSSSSFQKAENDLINMARANKEVGITVDDVKNKYPELAAAIEDAGLSLDDFVANVNGAAETALDGSTESIDNLKSSLSTVLEIQNNVNEVLGSINSTTGLSTTQIDTLVDAYKDLEGSSGKAYGSQKILDTLFTRTASGVRVNTKELERYNSELEKQTKKNYAEQIQAAQAALKQARQNGSDKDTINGLKEQLTTLKLLAAEYDGATSKFQKWVNAQETANAGDNFDTVSETMNDNAQDLYDKGLTNTDDFRAAANFYSYKDLTGASQAEVEAAWNAAEKARDRYFTGNKDGVDNFMRDVVAANDELGKNWVETTKDGLIKFNTGSDEAIAKYLGISTEAVQMILSKAQDYNDSIIVGNTEEVEKAGKDSLKSLQKTAKKAEKNSGKGGKKKSDDESDEDSGSSGSKKSKTKKRKVGDILSDVDLEYDQAEMSLDELDSKIEELEGAKVEIETECKGTDKAKKTIKDLDKQIQALKDQKVIVQIQTAIDQAIENGSSVEELLAMDNKTLAATLNIDTSQVDQAREQLELLNGQDIESSITVKIDESQFSKLTETDTMNTTKTIHVNAVLNDTAEVDGYQPDDKDALVTFDKDSSIPDEYQPDNKDATVTYHLVKPTYNPPDITRTVTYTVKTVGSTPSGGTVDATSGASKKGKGTYPAAGTLRAQASGTAYNMLDLHPYAFGTAGTDVTISHDQYSLINELGTEAIIRDGTLYEVPGGTHIQSLKKGDVVINAAQWEQIKKYGSINTFAGKAYASGTLNGDMMSAYSSGTWKFGGRGTSGYKKSSSSSSKSSSSSSSSSKSSSSSSSSSKSSSKSSSDDDEDDSEIIDWIEIAIDRIERAIDRLGTVATSPFRKLSTRLNATNKELTKLSSELSLQQSAYKKYIKQANSVGLSSSLKKKVKNGTIKITEYSGDTAEKIQEYQEWYVNALPLGNGRELSI